MMAAMGSQARWIERFEQTLTGPASPVRARIWRQVYGPETPAGPTRSMTELRRLAREVRVSGGQTLVDVGCGRGGPGLWVAAVTAARLVGVDADAAALAAAARRADQTGFASRARFHHATFDDTGLPSSSATR
jgi:predicted RNA methylase